MSAQQADKLDLMKAHKADYAKPKKPTRLVIPPARYLAVDGTGAPGEADFERAMQALFGMAYTTKFNSKFAGRDYTVSKLETLWGKEGESEAEWEARDRGEWPWCMLIRVPEFLEERDLEAARATLAEKGKEGDFTSVRLLHLDEGECAQVLHTGSYETLPETIATLHAFIASEGATPRSRQHDVYLNDPRRLPPERLQTIVRQPIGG